jgi:glycosyltransferase 2 family protein
MGREKKISESNNSSSKLLFIRIGKILLSGTLLGIVIIRTDIYQVLEKAKEVPFYILLFIPFLSALHILADVFIKQSMFSIFKFNISSLKLFKELYKGLFYGFFMPSFVGGDAYYIVIFGKNFKSYSKIISGIIFIKAIGLTIFTLIAGSSMVVLWEEIKGLLTLDSHKLIIYLVILSSIVFLAIVFLISGRLSLPGFIKKNLEKIKAIRTELFSSKIIIIRIILFTILFYTVSIGGRFMLGIMLDIPIQGLKLAMIIMLVNFIIILPVTISGIGLREASYIGLMGLFGVSQNEALLMAFFDFLISISGIAIGSVLILIDNLTVMRK